MKRKPMTHWQFIRESIITQAMINRANLLGVKEHDRKLSRFGKYQCVTEDRMFIIGRDGKIEFEARRK